MSSSKSNTVKIQRYYKVTKTSPKPLRPEDIHVEVNKSSSMSPGEQGQPNFVALALLWGHYQACQQGILNKDESSPWDINTDQDCSCDESDLWIPLLRQVITDRTWVNWIQDPAEVKRRALEAFAHIQSITNMDSETDSVEKGEEISPC